jgi:hypothetical protein
VPAKSKPKPNSEAAGSPVPTEAVFVPISMKAGPIEVELPNGAAVRFSSEVSTALVMEVIRAVGALKPAQEYGSC